MSTNLYICTGHYYVPVCTGLVHNLKNKKFLPKSNKMFLDCLLLFTTAHVNTICMCQTSTEIARK